MNSHGHGNAPASVNKMFSLCLKMLVIVNMNSHGHGNESVSVNKIFPLGLKMLFHFKNHQAFLAHPA
jgi:hypothetical protein